jgi:hypothetical protein
MDNKNKGFTTETKTTTTGMKIHDSNPDPITGEPGAHPLGVAGGGTGGVLAGAAIGGAVGGPVGAIVGGAIGAVAGGFAGKGAAEALNPTEEDTFWRTEHIKRPYVRKDMAYSTYQPAYKYGWESAVNPLFANRKFNDIEPDLAKNWNTFRGPVTTDWRDIKEATRDSFDRVRTRMANATVRTGEKLGNNVTPDNKLKNTPNRP